MSMPDSATDVVLLDPASAYPQLTQLIATLASRDWTAARKVLDELPPVGRSLVMRPAAASDGLEDFLREVVAGDPADSAAAAMLATHLIDVGWQIRSTARAPDVSARQFVQFHDWLRRAEVVLVDAIARTPDDPALWTARLTSGRGLSLGLAEAERRYGRLAAIDPQHLPGQRQYLQQLCPKWGGSWAKLHGWSREMMLAAPAGAHTAVLVVEAHLEHWATLPEGEVRYLRSEPVRRELHEAAERSLWHADFRRDFGWVEVASHFAMVFALLGDQRAAASAFTVLGELGTELPWSYLGGDPSHQLRQKRRWALGGTR
jgi:hypothetical protein